MQVDFPEDYTKYDLEKLQKILNNVTDNIGKLVNQLYKKEIKKKSIIQALKKYVNVEELENGYIKLQYNNKELNINTELFIKQVSPTTYSLYFYKNNKYIFIKQQETTIDKLKEDIINHKFYII